MRRVVRWLVGLALVATAAWGAVVALQPRPVEVDLAAASWGPLEVTVDEDGMTRIRERYVVSSPVGGQLLRIDLRPGDRVEANRSIVAAIRPSDPSMLDARQVAEAEARVAASRAMIDRAEARVEQARVAEELAESRFARLETLRTRNSISQDEFEAANAAVRLREAESRAAEFDREIAQFELQQAEAALLRIRPAAGTDGQPPANFDIAAPIDGVVLRVMQESATVVNPGTPLIELGNPVDLEIVVDVLSTDAVQIREGAAARIERWGGSRPLQAMVRRIEPAAFTKISALGVEEQRVNVIAEFREPPEQIAALGDGYRVDAQIVIWQSDRVLQVPASALFRRGEAWSVFVAEHGVARRQMVRLGHRNPLQAEILAGLQEGERVVLYPSDFVREGRAVVERPVEP